VESCHWTLAPAAAAAAANVTLDPDTALLLLGCVVISGAVGAALSTTATGPAELPPAEPFAYSVKR
jgi:hypothetical protein